MRLRLPRDEDVRRPAKLTEEELAIIQENVEKAERAINSIVLTRGDCAVDDPRVEHLRAKLHEDYDGIVLRDEVIPNPPERGEYGYAYIPLKEGAVPQRQKQFVHFG